ncbi:MFS transporter [Cohnella pontilimi]|uniref:MFS transporter n=1 Tax=Cohnella pontilimi TaxID=2564100 RepID=A0A4U0FAP5_9BACL|nr:MFS transporter [Cohnella pontilimi]TJY41815.1 MFS transporter [Cohnella pontilimi]
MQTQLSIENVPQKRTSLGASFRRFYTAVALTGAGDGMTTAALPWLAAALSGNALLVSMVSAASRLPWLLFSLPFGVMIDRFPRHVLMAVSSFVRAVMMGLITLSVYFGFANLPLLIVLTFLFGTAKVMYDSTAQTMVPMLVEQKELERANGLVSSVQLVTSDILGGALAGLLLTVGMPYPFLIDTLTSAASIPMLAGLKREETAVVRAHRLSFRHDLMQGVRFVWHDPLLRPLALFQIGMTGAFSVITAMQVFFIKEILHLNSFGFGVLISVATLGSIAGGQFVSRVKEKLGTRKSILLAIGVMAVGYGLCGVSSHWAVVGALYTIGAFFIVVWNVINVSFRQRIVPEELLGRVNGVFRFLSWGVASIGAVLGGVLITGGEPLIGREWALRSPYLLLFVVYAILWLIAVRLFDEDKLKRA